MFPQIFVTNVHYFADIMFHGFRIRYAQPFGSRLYSRSQMIGCLMASVFRRSSIRPIDSLS
jgi:hypothetical protein